MTPLNVLPTRNTLDRDLLVNFFRKDDTRDDTAKWSWGIRVYSAVALYI